MRYYLAQCRKQQGDEVGYKAELENALKGWVKPGEMNYYRFRALIELGKTGETSEVVATYFLDRITGLSGFYYFA